MMFPMFNTIEKLLRGIFDLIEQSSCVYIDEYYKWYELSSVARILRLDDDAQAEINGLYLMELNDDIYISEEGVNFALMNFDNLFKDDVTKIMSKDVMTDIKDYSMYMSSDVKDKVYNMGMSLVEDNCGHPDDVEMIKECKGQLLEYALDGKRKWRKKKNLW